ncbi:MAG: sigma-54-dependent Fis family transcriptional regulator [Bacteroidota bacterium]
MSTDQTSLKRRVEELEELQRFAHLLSTTLGISETLDVIAEHCMSMFNAERASIMLVTSHGVDTVRTIVRRTGVPDQEIEHLVNNLVAGWVMYHAKPLVTDDVVKALSMRDISKQIQQLGPALAVPLSIGGKVIGVINIVNSPGGRLFSEDDSRAATIVASTAAQFIHRAEVYASIAEDNVRLKKALREQQHPDLILGDSPAMKEIRDKIRLVAETSSTVLLTGETGTGKELAAKTIHTMSPRAGKPFVAVNCAAIPEALFESELFGHERGAFTGAPEMRKGKFELAHEGTIFLDEISWMPLALQPKLLRVLQERTVSRLGASMETNVDVRVIAASSRDLEHASQLGEFRQELFHRLNVVPLRLLPLREHRQDIPLLAETFLDTFSGGAKRFSSDGMELLTKAAWPGNVRELRNAMERVSIFVPSLEVTEFHLKGLGIGEQEHGTSDLSIVFRQLVRSNDRNADLLENAEKSFVQLAMQEAQGNVSQASRLLGIDRKALERRIEKFGL